ncbi:MAG: DUF559 domain-containing protein [Candidatus Hydrogenedentes bacterium]|nr:DUF559 domain-containing protein [Candidatus Hydrogenedentota bacterium]
MEVDGYTHTSPEAHERDEERDRRLAALGLRVMRFPDARVLKDLRGVLQEISEVLEDEEYG